VLGNVLAFACPPSPPRRAARPRRRRILYLGVLQIGLAYWLFSRALRQLRALEVSLLVLLEPVLNPLWTWLLLGERPTPLASAGGAVMIVALAARTLVERRREAAPAPAPV
jgi:drug/metabolite transporter (DMT)-like permease